MTLHTQWKPAALTMLALLIILPGSSAPTEDAPAYTTDFLLQNADLVPNGRNAYFSLIPGTRIFLAGEDDGEFVEVEIKVMNETHVVFFTYNGVPMVVRTRVVREREWVDGELVEVSRNYFARDRRTGNIYYFGEIVNIFEDGEVVSHDGAWLAGINDAQPGLIMPSLFLTGSRYYQEIAPDVALDRAKNVTSGFEYTTPAGTYQNCIRISETTPLEPGSVSVKIYAPGVGLIYDDGVELVEFYSPLD